MVSEKSIDGHRNIIIGDGANAQIEISNYSNSVTKTEVDYQSQFSNLPTDIIPPPSSLPAGSRIAFPVNQAFVGRGSALRQLARTLKGGDATAIGQVTAAPVWVVLENLNSLVNSRIDTDSTFPVVCSG